MSSLPSTCLLADAPGRRAAPWPGRLPGLRGGRLLGGVAAGLMYLFLLVQGGLADAAPRTDPRAAPSPELLQVFADQRLALHLIRHGDRKGDPVALILAARIQKQIGTRTGPDSPLSADALLDRATKLAGQRQDLLDLIKDERSSASRGAVIGPRLERLFASPNAPQDLKVRFVGGAPALVEVQDKDGQPIMIEVLDAQGRNVCAGRSAVRNCNWKPDKEAEFSIRIRNLGPVAGEFSLFHN